MRQTPRTSAPASGRSSPGQGVSGHQHLLGQQWWPPSACLHWGPTQQASGALAQTLLGTCRSGGASGGCGIGSIRRFIYNELQQERREVVERITSYEAPDLILETPKTTGEKCERTAFSKGRRKTILSACTAFPVFPPANFHDGMESISRTTPLTTHRRGRMPLSGPPCFWIPKDSGGPARIPLPRTSPRSVAVYCLGPHETVDTSVSQSVDPGPPAAAAPENGLEMQILEPHPRSIKSETQHSVWSQSLRGSLIYAKVREPLMREFGGTMELASCTLPLGVLNVPG
ncbi:uncharacterized protein LOC121035336 [Herpailurus yagouaroundi]|uniref:uncharacterized protein LOC121035336 n=1 Tax=Herpailurus yagouaroundi TaxID=1608482 RepID=UPI001AD6FCCD|nr:uncharacterized protein LOC121035336 [Puma yagouaroundi]